MLTNLGMVAAMTALSVFAQNQAPVAPTPSAARPAPISPTNQLGRPIQRFDRTLQNVNDEQRQKIQEANKEYNEKATPTYARLTSARRELETLVSAEKFDEVAVRQKAREIGDLEADLAIARGQRYAKFRSFLTAEQARRFNQAPPIARPFQPALHDGQAPPPVAPSK
jgi:Spy/CpxP family protein refolding chaperone